MGTAGSWVGWWRQSSGEVDRVALLQRHDRLLPRPRVAGAAERAAVLAGDVDDVDLDDLDLEQGLDGLLDLAAVGLRRDLEGELVVELLQHRRLLGHERTLQQVVVGAGVGHQRSPLAGFLGAARRGLGASGSPVLRSALPGSELPGSGVRAAAPAAPKRAFSASSASGVTTSQRRSSTWRALRSPTGQTSTSGTLRSDSHRLRSFLSVTTVVLRCMPSCARIANAAFVLGLSLGQPEATATSASRNFVNSALRTAARRALTGMWYE